MLNDEIEIEDDKDGAEFDVKLRFGFTHFREADRVDGG